MLFVGTLLSLRIGKKLNCHGIGYNQFWMLLKRIFYHSIHIQQDLMDLQKRIDYFKKMDSNGGWMR